MCQTNDTLFQTTPKTEQRNSLSFALNSLSLRLNSLKDKFGVGTIIVDYSRDYTVVNGVLYLF